MTPSVLARLERFTYRYPERRTPALDGADVTLRDGLTLVAGASGSGKSTLLRVFNGLVPHFHGGSVSGSAVVCGSDVLTTPTRLLARQVGFVFQDPELQSVYPSLERDVAFGLENTAMAPALMHTRVAEALERTGITHLRGRAVATLSGGERQRLALAGVLAMRPRILVLDEPLSQLDDAGAQSLVATLGDLVAAGTAVVVAEHRLDPFAACGGQRLEVIGGRVGIARESTTRPAPQPRRAAREPGHAAGQRPAAWRMNGVATGPARVPIVEGVSIEGRAGEVVALVGPNGGGKTTLLRTIAGLLEPIHGHVERAPGRVAFLPQNPMALLHRPTVASEVAWTVRGDRRSTDAATLMADLGLTHLVDRDPRDLSSGERQRAAIAAVLAGAPRLALLDEPTRGMDDTAREGLCRVIGRLRDAGCSVVLATHDRHLAAGVADRSIAVGGGVARPAGTAAVA